MWPDKVRDTWQAQKNMMISWTSVVRLDGSDLGDERIDMYANMVDDLMDKPWQQLVSRDCEDGEVATHFGSFRTG